MGCPLLPGGTYPVPRGVFESSRRLRGAVLPITIHHPLTSITQNILPYFPVLLEVYNGVHEDIFEVLGGESTTPTYTT